MRQSATVALTVLTVIVSAVYLPMLYEKLFFDRIEKTHLLFSPVTKRFIYKEKIVGAVPSEARKKAEDHHAEIAYRDADGTYYDRVEFEKRLPFIYYKNMELWGLLPLKLNGAVFDIKDIKDNRRVLELKPDEINGSRPETALWPLLESDPGQARLVFPEDRFRMTDHAMQFVNADYNVEDKELTASFTKALKDEGFVFPARSVNGKFTILKPFDEGVFLVDSEYHVFHVKRKDGRPVAVKTPIDPSLKTRDIKVSENKQREYYGLLLSGDGGLYLLAYDNYRLIRLPLEHYEPDRMDFKIVMNPLYRTAVYSDDTTIRAVAVDADYRPVGRYEHTMSRAKETVSKQVYEILFPFVIHLKQEGEGYLNLSLKWGGLVSLLGLLGSLACLFLWRRIRRRRRPHIAEICLVALTGVYGLIAVSFIGSEA